MKIFSVRFFLIVFLVADFFIPLFLVLSGYTIASTDNLLGSLSISDINLEFLSYSLLFIVCFFIAYSIPSSLNHIAKYWTYLAQKLYKPARNLLSCQKSVFVIFILTAFNLLAFSVVYILYPDAISSFFKLRLNVSDSTGLSLISKYKSLQLAINTSLIFAVFSYFNPTSYVSDTPYISHPTSISLPSYISPIIVSKKFSLVIFLCTLNIALLSCVHASRGLALFTILTYYVSLKWRSIKNFILNNRKILLVLILGLPLGLWLFALLSSIRQYLQYQNNDITIFSLNMLFNAFEGHSLRASNLLIKHCVEFSSECSRNGTYLANLSIFLKPFLGELYEFNGLFIPNNLLGLPQSTLPAYSIIGLSYLNFGILGIIESFLYGLIAKYLDTHVKNTFPSVYVAIVLPSVPVFYWMGLISLLSILINLVLAFAILSAIKTCTTRLTWSKSI